MMMMMSTELEMANYVIEEGNICFSQKTWMKRGKLECENLCFEWKVY
jgi:hypothetical protein